MKAYLFAFVLLGVATGCQLPAGRTAVSEIEYPAPFKSHGLRVEVEGVYRTYRTVTGLVGKATNTTKRDKGNCILTFEVLDSGGNKVSDAIATTQSLRAGATWKFQATFLNPFRTEFKKVQPGKVQVLPTTIGGSLVPVRK